MPCKLKLTYYLLKKIGVARMQDDDPRTGHFQAVQVALNNRMRLVSGNKLIDKVPVRMLSDETGIRSLNQMYAQDNLLLAWQNIRDPDAPISAAFGSICGHPTMPSRSKTRGNVRESARSTLARPDDSSFYKMTYIVDEIVVKILKIVQKTRFIAIKI